MSTRCARTMVDVGAEEGRGIKTDADWQGG
jgi:hypothetical protein